jgi:hypothetical protein
LVFAADKIDITAAEIRAVLADKDVIRLLKHNIDSSSDGIVKIEGAKSMYSIYVREACWATYKVKSHPDSKTGNVIVDSVSRYNGACD